MMSSPQNKAIEKPRSHQHETAPNGNAVSINDNQEAIIVEETAPKSLDEMSPGERSWALRNYMRGMFGR